MMPAPPRRWRAAGLWGIGAAAVLVACEGEPRDGSDGRSGGPPPPSLEATGGSEAEVRLEEYAFVPDTLRLPAGRDIRLRIRNGGVEAHEFVVGREMGDGAFETPFFRGVDVDAEGPVAAAEVAPGDTSRSPAAHPPADRDRHPYVMAHLQPGEEATLRFRVPPSHEGTWTIACFVPGHLERGMRGVLIVGPAS